MILQNHTADTCRPGRTPANLATRLRERTNNRRSRNERTTELSRLGMRERREESRLPGPRRPQDPFVDCGRSAARSLRAAVFTPRTTALSR